MKRNTPNECISAYSWQNMDNKQRHAVVKYLEEEYGSRFAHEAHFGNQYCKPAVKDSQLLSSKKNLTKDSIDFYLETMMSSIVAIKTFVPIALRLPIVKENKDCVGETRYAVYGINKSEPNRRFAEAIHFSEKAANETKDRLDKIIDLKKLGGYREVSKYVCKKPMYEVLVWKEEDQAYIPHYEFPIYEEKKYAVDRAAHDTRFIAAFFMKWETWKEAGYKAPEEFDYFEKENILNFDKKALLAGHASPNCSDNWNIAETSYWKKLINPEIDKKFLEFCSKL